ncbi:hypothetical protein BV22DRAFT_980061, partial [Leucogyrophana mollusca]
RTEPDTSAIRLYQSWQAAIPTLVHAHLAYFSATAGQHLKLPDGIVSACNGDCETKASSITCLYFDREYCFIF